MSDQNSPGGWTQYQKLVLAELQRHEQQNEATRREIMEIRLKQQQQMADVEAIGESLKEFAATLKDCIAEVKQTKSESTDQKIDIRLLQWKLGSICAALAALGGILGSKLGALLVHMFGG